MKMNRTFTVAFCGAGGIVRANHLPNLEARRDCFAVTGFFDVATEKMRELAGNRYKAYPTYAALLADPAVEIVVVATKPLASHHPAARQALEAGKHVVLEKPMAATSKECDELIAAAKKAGRLLTVHHNRRLDLDFLALMDVLNKGKIGDPRLVVSNVGGGGYSGGDIEDWGVHLVDQALLANRSPLVEVSALLAKPAGGTQDGGFCEATFRFAKPPVTRVSLFPRAQEFLLNGTPPEVRFYAVGTAGTFIQRTIETPLDLMNATQNFDNWRPDYAVPDYLQITRKEYYDHLYESLASGAPLLVKPEEARNAIRAFELITESARLGRAVPATGMLTVEMR